MKNRKLILVLLVNTAIFSLLAGSCAGNRDLISVPEGKYMIEIEAGEAWLHDFRLFAGFHSKNPPQYAVWIEDLDGNYLDTVVVSEKIAKEKWIFNGGNRRVEALPYWMFRRGISYSDGLMLPNGNEPLPDSVTSATATKSSTVYYNPAQADENIPVRIVAEFNHSTDFNENWPADAVPRASNWSGGEYGSGQPAVVYAAEFVPSEIDSGAVELKLIGRSSADGSDGDLVNELDGLTSALEIVSSVKIRLNN